MAYDQKEIDKMKFPCPYHGSGHVYVILDTCSSCTENKRCDVYATMLDEQRDRMKDI